MGTRSERWEPLSGVLFAVLMIVGGLLASTGLAYGSVSAEVATFFETSTDRIRAGAIMGLLSAAALLWFVGCLRRRLTADGDDGRLAATVAIAGGAGAAVTLVASASLMAAVVRIGHDGSIGPPAAAALWDLFGVLASGATSVTLAVIVAATTVAAQRSGWFATWASWTSGAIVLGLLSLVWYATAIGLLWIIVVSFAMTIRPTRDRTRPEHAPTFTPAR